MVKAAGNITKLRSRGRVQGGWRINSCSHVGHSPHSVDQITGENGHLIGDGLAVWLTSGRAQPGPVFGNVGASMLFSYCSCSCSFILMFQITSMGLGFSLTRMFTSCQYRECVR